MEVTPDQIEQVSATFNVAMARLEEQLEMWIDLVCEAMAHVRSDPALARKEAKEGLQEIARVRQMLLHERDRHLEAYKKEAGAIHGTLIDFETERIAIAGKLDRLRVAGAADSVPG